MITLEQVLAKYRSHPDFLGLDLRTADQRGAVDDGPLHIAARKGELEDVAVLVAHGADVNGRGDLGNTPLHSAALNGHAPVVAKLLELGADPSLRNEFSETALRVAQLGALGRPGIGGRWNKGAAVRRKRRASKDFQYPARPPVRGANSRALVLARKSEDYSLKLRPQ